MPRENRIRTLYRKYINRTSSEEELEEMFTLLRENDGLESVREILRENWEKDTRIEELASMDWDSFISKVRKSETPTHKHRTRPKTLVVRLSVAAGLLLILGIAAWTWMHREIMTIYETNYGEVEEIVLNDNSVVRLNANSRLYWDSNWKRRGSRNVRIEGEAFFNVSHLDGNRFYVSTPDVTVMVTGTAFNVTRRREETKVFLESGEVFLQLNQEDDIVTKRQTPSDKSGRMLKMMPGEQLSYSRKTEELVHKNNLTVKEAASWKTGELIFKDIPLRDVLQELSDVYGKSFVVEDSALFDRKIDGGMPYKDWKTVKGLMQFMMNVTVTEMDNQVTIK